MVRVIWMSISKRMTLFYFLVQPCLPSALLISPATGATTRWTPCCPLTWIQFYSKRPCWFQDFWLYFWSKCPTWLYQALAYINLLFKVWNVLSILLGDKSLRTGLESNHKLQSQLHVWTSFPRFFDIIQESIFKSKLNRCFSFD